MYLSYFQSQATVQSLVKHLSTYSLVPGLRTASCPAKGGVSLYWDAFTDGAAMMGYAF